jgi:hypothetical protein
LDKSFEWRSLASGRRRVRRSSHRDRNIEFQQNLKTLPIAVVVLTADSNRLESLEPLVPKLLQILAAVQPKTLVRVGANK